MEPWRSPVDQLRGFPVILSRISCMFPELRNSCLSKQHSSAFSNGSEGHGQGLHNIVV